jgi:hypothetical protein
MNSRKPAKRPRGKPFAKGNDPRRNMNGNLNAEAQSYEIRFRNALAEGLSPKEFAGIVIEDVRRHRPGAKEFYADRLMGKATQPISGSLGLDMEIKAKQIHDAIKQAQEVNGK